MPVRSRYVEITPARLHTFVARGAFVVGLVFVVARFQATDLDEVHALDAIGFPALAAVLVGGAAALFVRGWTRGHRLHAAPPSMRPMMGAFEEVECER